MPGKITIDPVNGNDLINSAQVAATLQYSGTEQKLDGATLTFICEINYGNDRIPWAGAPSTTAAGGRWLTPVTGEGYTGSTRDGIYTITASSGSVSASRTLIQSDHINQVTNHVHSPLEAVGLAFDEETQQLTNSPSFFQVDQFITAEQPGSIFCSATPLSRKMTPIRCGAFSNRSYRFSAAKLSQAIFCPLQRSLNRRRCRRIRRNM